MFNVDDLNQCQRDGVLNTEGPLLILAGAGSGKTRVITYRIAHMIKNMGVRPDRILAITFTNKAANEMKERVKALIGDEGNTIWIGTFHSICVRILRREIEKIGYDKSFVIYDTGDQGTVLKDCLKELNYNEKNYPIKMLQSEISKAKNELIDNKQYFKLWQNDFRLSKIANVYNLYQRKLTDNNALDFDDIIFKTIELFTKHQDVLLKYQDRFKYILVDEYQDTNAAQYELISLLASIHQNLCVVGDDDQSIYGWRGANIRNILDFEKQFKNTMVIKLEQNYRSTENILNAANNVIKNNMGRKTKKLWTEKSGGELITLFNSTDEHDEANFAANEIVKGIMKDGLEYSHFAVLYRTNAQSRVFEEHFIKESIPYRIIGGLKFYDRKEIKDIIGYLRVIQNPNDTVSLKRIINVPKRGIGTTTIERYESSANEMNCSFYKALKYDLSNAKIFNFLNMIDSFMDKKDRMTITQLINEILENTGYIRTLEEENTIEAQTRIENLKEFVSVAIDFDKNSEEKSLEEFLAGISLISDLDNLEGQENAVVMMTMHSAKGLEYPYVFVSGMDEGIFPSFKSALDETELEEERRLCYVGITRAKEKLYLTTAKQRTIYGNTSYYSPSRFIKEIPNELIDRKGFAGGFATPKQPKDNVKHVNNDSIFSKSFKDMFTYANNNNAAISTDYTIGAVVEHAKFGIGKIADVQMMGNDKMIKIIFEKVGAKQLMANFANLKIVD